MCSDHPTGKRSTSASPGLPARIGLVLIRVYQLTLSAFIGRSCRYAPSCSGYAADAIAHYGLWAGSWVGLARLQRCRPGGGSGFDPIPDQLPESARWYLPWRYGRWTANHIDPATRLD